MDFVLEIRPRLQSVNAFVKLREDSDDYAIALCANSFKILKNDSLIETIDLEEHCVVEKSLTSLVIKDGFIAFRFACNSFESELLEIQSGLLNFNITNRPRLNEGVLYKIQCCNCSHDLASVNFARILPLPDHLEPNDWYCHGDHCSKDNNLDPKCSDLFYSNCYFHINSDSFTDNSSRKYLTCTKCQSWLGTKINENTARFWFNTVGFVSEGNRFQTVALNDVFKCVRDILSETSLVSAKIILDCQIGELQVDHLLLWILEKKLAIVTRNDAIASRSHVSKLLFKFISGPSDLVDAWRKDSATHNVTVSKAMMGDLLKHLHEMNHLIPKYYGVSNGFFISYARLYE